MTSSSAEDVVLCCISPPFEGLSTTRGQITYVLLTRAPLYRGRSPFSFDLHVLSAPLTFVLSQDQTLQLILLARPIPLSRLGPFAFVFAASYLRLAFRPAEVLRTRVGIAYSSVFKDRGEAAFPAGDAVFSSAFPACQPLFRRPSSFLPLPRCGRRRSAMRRCPGRAAPRGGSLRLAAAALLSSFFSGAASFLFGGRCFRLRAKPRLPAPPAEPRVVIGVGVADHTRPSPHVNRFFWRAPFFSSRPLPAPLPLPSLPLHPHPQPVSLCTLARAA